MKKRDVNAWVKAWVKALRSGEYEQCRARLHDGKGFCCLGVAIDVLVEGDWQLGDSDRLYKFGGDFLFPTDQVLDKIGLSSGISAKLAEFNDNGKSFKWIASWIERNAHRLNSEK